MSTEDALVNVLKAPPGISRFFPIRIVLRKDETGTIKGLCEESYSMGVYPSSVRIWWSGKAYSMLGEHNLDGVADATYNSKDGDMIVDPFSDDCPIEIDWDKWMAATSKFDKRNAPFKLKETEK